MLSYLLQQNLKVTFICLLHQSHRGNIDFTTLIGVSP